MEEQAAWLQHAYIMGLFTTCCNLDFVCANICTWAQTACSSIACEVKQGQAAAVVVHIQHTKRNILPSSAFYIV